jgi:hypothetical protein
MLASTLQMKQVKYFITIKEKIIMVLHYAGSVDMLIP